MEWIQGREIVLSKNFLIPRGESLRIELPIEGWTTPVFISFTDNPNEPNNRRIDVHRQEMDQIHFEFINWDNPLGTALISPAEFAVLSNRDRLFFLAVNYRIGQTNNFSIQVMKETGHA